MPKILLLSDDPELTAKTKAAAPGYDVIVGFENPGGADIAVTQGFGRTVGAVIDNSPNLRWVQTWSAGVDAVPLDKLKERGIYLTNASGVHAKPISESVFAFMLAAARGLYHSAEAQYEGKWNPRVELREIHGAVLGILGAGAIGAETARIAKAFGMKTLGFARREGARENFDTVTADINAVLSESDYVVNILPHTKDTRGIMGAEQFAKMKPSAMYISVGRGPTTDFDALAAALNSAAIAAAGVDVTVPEPLPDGHPLFSVPNLYITPHISGGTPYYQSRASEIFIENLKSFVSTGKPCRNIVDLDAGY
ncbi:MAG: D-2-hydroxyacid dehydrogenase [Oscillospiraceae bacterium]|jgi:phosphoglycerate dehydrogenase-like enzyme|nr:D-2-hydroxyacid dehydrogenase [Oscillospiraceae bacterium]